MGPVYWTVSFRPQRRQRNRPDNSAAPRSLNEYELDLLRQRSLAARHEKARRGELVVGAPVGLIKVGDRLEMDPDRRVQAAIRLAIDKVAELGSVRQALFWFLEHGLDLKTRVHGGCKPSGAPTTMSETAPPACLPRSMSPPAR